MGNTDETGARAAYEALAPAYDIVTAGYPYGRWLAALEALAQEHGLEGHRLLDVACGTGSSFLPLYERGYEVCGVDISPAMISRARAKAPRAELSVADMRDLPTLGSFDLVTCLDDAANYLLDEAELTAALTGIRRNLAPDGIALWDLNTAAQYDGHFSDQHIFDRSGEGIYVGWPAASRDTDRPLVETDITIFTEAERDLWRRELSVHRQRHWSVPEVTALAAQAGLRLLDIRGQRPGAVIDDGLDESVHIKAIYVAEIQGEEDRR